MTDAPTRKPMPALVCQCGCDEPIPPKGWHRWKPPKYIAAHYLRSGTALRIEKLREAKVKARISPPEGWAIPDGLCACGCGLKTRKARFSRPERGEYFGYPRRWISGHNASLNRRERSGPWKGGRRIVHGYVALYRPEDPRSNSQGLLMEHRLVYEESRGVQLPKTVQVHHINGDRTDNRAENLVALTRMEHSRVHRLANEMVSLFLDDRLLEAARESFKETGELPDLEVLTQQVYG